MLRPIPGFLWRFSLYIVFVLGAGGVWAGDYEDGVAAYNAKNYETAYRLLRPSADHGNAASQNYLGFMHQTGSGVAKNLDTAAGWYRLSAAQGYAVAQSNLGLAYQTGAGVAKDYAEALKWFRLAAAQAYAPARRNLGAMYESGLGVARDYDEALKWYRLAAAQGDARARSNIGSFYQNGYGVAKDFDEAIKWYRLAAGQGNAPGQRNLGFMYHYGLGVAKDYDEALKWYRLAAAQADGAGQNNLGVLYRDGLGVAKDNAEALKWFRLAAAQGQVNAQRSLGYMAESGLGQAQDYQEAVRWYRLAAAQGNVYAKERLEMPALKLAAERNSAPAVPSSAAAVPSSAAAATSSTLQAASEIERQRLDLERMRLEFEREKLAFEQQRLAASRISTTAVPAATGPGAQPGAKRVALVIGNAAYRSTPLQNPVNDARAVSQKLRSFGYSVLLKENLKASEIGGVMAEFANRITPGAEAIFFYAGHGVQLRGENFFPAVDADIKTEFDMPTQSIALGRVLDLMQDRKAGLSLVLLDSCRDNPFLLASRSLGRGLAPVQAASGTLLAYATRPGSVAQDGTGTNGVYTTALLRHIDTPNLPIEILLKRIAGEVKRETKGAQEPWTEGNIDGDFMFVRK